MVGLPPIFRQSHKKFTSQQSPSGLIGGSKLHPMDGTLLPHTTNCSIGWSDVNPIHVMDLGVFVALGYPKAQF